jgi:hypothetical protein
MFLLKRRGTEIARGDRQCSACGVVHPEDALCQMTITRRRFLFLGGATFVVANLDPTALITPMEHAGVSRVSAFMLDDANRILKEVYIPAIREQLNAERDLWQKIAGPYKLNAEGLPFEVPFADIRGDTAARERRRKSESARRHSRKTDRKLFWGDSL